MSNVHPKSPHSLRRLAPCLAVFGVFLVAGVAHAAPPTPTITENAAAARKYVKSETQYLFRASSAGAERYEWEADGDFEESEDWQPSNVDTSGILFTWTTNRFGYVGLRVRACDTTGCSAYATIPIYVYPALVSSPESRLALDVATGVHPEAVELIRDLQCAGAVGCNGNGGPAFSYLPLPAATTAADVEAFWNEIVVGDKRYSVIYQNHSAWSVSTQLLNDLHTRSYNIISSGNDTTSALALIEDDFASAANFDPLRSSAAGALLNSNVPFQRRSDSTDTRREIRRLANNVEILASDSNSNPDIIARRANGTSGAWIHFQTNQMLVANPCLIATGRNLIRSWYSVTSAVDLSAYEDCTLVSGRVVEDINADANLDDGRPFEGVSIRAWQDDGDGVPDADDTTYDVWVTETDANGNFTLTLPRNFATNGNEVFWLRTDSRNLTSSLGLRPGVDPNVEIRAEQTFGPRGSLCSDPATGESAAPSVASGACFGGRRGELEDRDGLDGAEHIARLDVVLGEGVFPLVNRDSAFSFSAVTHASDRITARQGSLRQFLVNSNALNGTQNSVFSMTTPANAQEGAVDYWRLVLVTQLPTIEDRVNLDALGVGGSNDTPLFEINGSGEVRPDTNGLVVSSEGSLIRGLAVNRFGGEGVLIDGGEGNSLQNMYIGLGVDGTTERGNRSNGVLVRGSSDNRLGVFNDRGNRIAHNGRAGVAVEDGQRNTIRRNDIFGNGGLGIDLNNDGVTANDGLNDLDAGANDLVNYPMHWEVVNNGGDTSVTGRLVARPNTEYIIELFGSNEFDPSFFGEGEFYFFSGRTTTDAEGVSNFVIDVGFFPLSPLHVSMTATDPEGNTSEFGSADDFDGLTILEEDLNGDGNPNNDDTDDDNIPNYFDPDDDGDGVDTIDDNCPLVRNPSQTNADNDAQGDACDDDLDNDGIANDDDNCPEVSNPNQANADGDDFGDACDPDRDGDGVNNTVDNCPEIANADQTNTDNSPDGGDACDEDDDNDGVNDVDDNCALISNADQANADGDAFGDVCDDDIDGDGVNNDEDNCPNTENVGQEDLNLDGQGDACDPDVDGDGTGNDEDNCPRIANADQTNTDNADDGGDACDEDDDNDGVNDVDDNCPTVANPDQENDDGDAFGNVCDGDADGDTILDENDNCPDVANTNQTNTDNADDGGDACDDDDDNDGVDDTADNCPLVSNADQSNSDGDDFGGDVCDDDDDNDGVADVDDNCPLVANADQANSDGDDFGDLCDDDRDGDGADNDDDNCPLIANADQSNIDGDDFGDACDPDDDGDGFNDEDDNCPTVENPGQEDENSNNIGDACEQDTDEDGVPDVDDNCIDVSNPDQANTDNADDGGDACDDDDDNDGVDDVDDNCPLVANSDQSNADDADDGGDACDDDDDNDGVDDVDDNCVLISNEGQGNLDEDEFGDVCDDDIDGDGLSNDDEDAAGTSSIDTDSDDDGVLDNEEPLWNEDSDGDGLSNANDPDSDNDGILDGTERGLTEDDLSDDTDTSVGNFVPDADPETTTDPLSDDSDGGNSLDGAEDANQNGRVDEGETDPNDPTDDIVVVDTDGDGVADEEDNCSLVPNPDQLDTDEDTVGDACDDDDDDDNIPDTEDNCPGISNPDQVDSNGNGVGDACDEALLGEPCAEGLGECTATGVYILNDEGVVVCDAQPEAPAPEDTEAFLCDGRDNDCDGQIDNGLDCDDDGVDNPEDNCPGISNADQADSDGDGIGDACEDDDGDGVPAAEDNCPGVANPGQEDTDNNGVGDACEEPEAADDDNDNVPNDADNCINTPNEDQADSDGDGVGDVCDSDPEVGGEPEEVFIGEVVGSGLVCQQTRAPQPSGPSGMLAVLIGAGLLLARRRRDP